MRKQCTNLGVKGAIRGKALKQQFLMLKQTAIGSA